MQTPTPQYWRKCNTCKKPLSFSQKYYVCSVSTCNRVRTGLVFCSVSCFDAHVPMMNHRDSGAFEKQAPTLGQWLKEQAAQLQQASAPAAQQAPKQTSPAPEPSRQTLATSSSGTSDDTEILVVVSKVKDYIRKRAFQKGHGDVNTSDRVMNLLSDRIRSMARAAIQRADQAGRKTVLDRDI